MQVFVDGNTVERIGNYAQWKIVDEDGNMLCMCYGPMSATVAATVAREMRLDKQAAVSEVLNFCKN